METRLQTQWPIEAYDGFQKQHQLKYGLELLSKLEQHADFAGSSIVDLGCGSGELTLSLKGRVGKKGRVIGVDRDGGMLAAFRGKAEASKVEIVESDLLTWLSSTEESFDVVFSNAALHWLPGYEAFERLVRLINRRLRDPGHLAFRFSLLRNAEAVKDLLEACLRDYLDQPQLQLSRSIFEFRESLSCVERNGFRILYSEEKGYRPFTDREMSFQWMVSSQPMGTYLPEGRLADFEEFLLKVWQKNPVEVRSHHAVIIAEKVVP